MEPRIVGVAWYRFRSTFARWWGGYLALALMVGLLGGLAIGTVAAARRTQSSFPPFLHSTNPSDLSTVTGVLIPLVGSNLGYDPSLVRAIAHLPRVKRVVSASGLDVLPLGPDGAPAKVVGLPPSAGNGLGSDDTTSGLSVGSSCCRRSNRSPRLLGPDARGPDRDAATGRAGANTATDHIVLLDQALAQLLQSACLDGDLVVVEPKTLRYRILHCAGRVVHRGRRVILRLPRHWPWAAQVASADQRVAIIGA